MPGLGIWGGIGRNGARLLIGLGYFFGSDENVLELESGESYITLNILII